ncbi:PE-PPE domain-containing protein, partial [Mycobacterium sp.]|uniref:PE-PPE domain-containing protein n=1 Tax=Mycobacterium sp. TaxID=1785 RepID=UPI003C78F277
LCIADSWPGQMRTVFGDHDRFVQTYFSTFKGLYFTGDGARRDADGIGAGSGDFTGGGFDGYNLAYAGGTSGVWGNDDIASVLGNSSNAVAGSDLLNNGTTAYDHDIATVFGEDNDTANATGAGGQYDSFSAFGHQTGGAAGAGAASVATTSVATTSDVAAAVTPADGYNPDFLAGSTNALVLGPTGISTPDAAYINDALNLYLYPNGYEGNAFTTLPLTTPETNDFQTSVAQGEQILTNAIVADYNAGDMGCNAAGVCADPLTIFTYSQSSAIASLDEPTLIQDGVPIDALRFVMLGANPTGVPDNLYPTEIYDIHGDTYAEPGVLGTTQQDILFGAELHDAYLGLTPTEIASATPTVEGMTTFYDIPTLTTAELYTALLDAAAAGT